MRKMLKNHKYANCHVEINGLGDIFFVSYKWYSPICIRNDGWTMFGDPHYSATTAKQVGWFLKEYIPDLTYQTVKKLYHDNMEYNVYTGEVRPAI